jgi:hypothetical protein
MVESTQTGRERLHAAFLPRGSELRRAPAKVVDERSDDGVSPHACHVGTELRHHPAQLVAPVDNEPSHRLVGRHERQQVGAIDEREQPGLRVVPHQDLPARSEHIGRRRIERVDQTRQPVRHHITGLHHDTSGGQCVQVRCPAASRCSVRAMASRTCADARIGRPCSSHCAAADPS